MRELRDEKGQFVKTPQDGEESSKEKDLNVLKIGDEVIKPYLGNKAELTPGKLDKKGNVVTPGEPRHFVVRADYKTWKLIRVYRARGFKRSLVRTLKPEGYKNDKARQSQDRTLLRRLKEAGIPGTSDVKY